MGPASLRIDWTDALLCSAAGRLAGASRRAYGRRAIFLGTYSNGPFTFFVGRVPMWKVVLAVAAVIAVIAGAAVLAGTVVLLLLPVVVVAALVHRLMRGRWPTEPRRRAPRGREPIEGEYVAIEEERIEIEPDPDAMRSDRPRDRER